MAPGNFADPVAGAVSTISLMLALRERAKTGKGQLIDSPMLTPAFSICPEQIVEYSAFGELMTREGNRSPHAAPQNLYLAGDDDEYWLALAVETDDQWERLRELLGFPEWADDPSLRTHWGRRAAHDLLDEKLSEWVAARRGADAMARLLQAGVPAGKFMPHSEVESVQARSRGFVELIDHPVIGRYQQIGWPARFSRRQSPWHRGHAPLLGQDNDDVLTSIGIPAEEIERLRDETLIAQAPAYN
jgi:crotonobetainyl-CoA:carnitine CoA-transferase CaiB-like acyl-CoA transferase